MLSPVAALPVTPLPIQVDPVEAPVFGKSLVFQTGDAPKATRIPPSGIRFGKGIRIEAAEAHESSLFDKSQRVVGDFCNSESRQL